MPSKPYTQMTLGEMQKQAVAGYNAQTNMLDKLWYVANYGAYVSLINDVQKQALDVPDYLLDEAPEDPAELANAKRNYRQEHPADFYTDEELKRLEMPVNVEAAENLGNVSNVMNNTLTKSFANVKTLDDIVERYKLLGIIQAKAVMEVGKAYEQKLNMFPEDEEFREEKAYHLQVKDTGSPAALMGQSVINNNFNYASALNKKSYTDKMLKGTPVESLESLKRTTIGELYAATMYTREEMEKMLEDHRKDGFQCDENMNAYEFLKQEHAWTENKKRQKFDNYVIKEADDEQILNQAQGSFTRNLMQNAQKYGSRIVRETLSKEDKKLFDIGFRNMSDMGYSVPKEIKKWAETQAPDMIRQGRVEHVNQNYKHFAEEVEREESYHLKNNPPLRKAFGKHLNGKVSEYDKFIHSHLGANAILGGKDDRRARLALVMAANQIEATSPGVFDRKAMESIAANLMERKAFKEMSDMDVSEALLSKENVLKAQKSMVRKTFGVAKADRAEYIRKMKTLSETMASERGQSEKYNKLKKAVEGIAKLNPNDPEISKKMLDANVELMQSISGYTKGKKSVRTFQDSQDRFDNSIDALAIANEHVPGLKQYAKEIVDRTNEVRKTKPGDEHFVDLAAYGAERARLHAPANALIHQSKPMQDLTSPKIKPINL